MANNVKVIGILLGTALNLNITFESIVILESPSIFSSLRSIKYYTFHCRALLSPWLVSFLGIVLRCLESSCFSLFCCWSGFVCLFGLEFGFLLVVSESPYIALAIEELIFYF